MSKLELPEDPGLAKKILEAEHKKATLKIKAGWLGTFFGDGNNVGLYIVGLISLMLLLTATIYTFLPDSYRSVTLKPGELWNLVLPIITTLIGYIFGFSNRLNREPNQ